MVFPQIDQFPVIVVDIGKERFSLPVELVVSIGRFIGVGVPIFGSAEFHTGMEERNPLGGKYDRYGEFDHFPQILTGCTGNALGEIVVEGVIVVAGKLVYAL
mgnify:CR=1 FL=1